MPGMHSAMRAVGIATPEGAFEEPSPPAARGGSTGSPPAASSAGREAAVRAPLAMLLLGNMAYALARSLPREVRCGHVRPLSEAQMAGSAVGRLIARVQERLQALQVGARCTCMSSMLHCTDWCMHRLGVALTVAGGWCSGPASGQLHAVLALLAALGGPSLTAMLCGAVKRVHWRAPCECCSCPPACMHG